MIEKQNYMIELNLDDAESILDILRDKPINLGRLHFLTSLLEEKIQDQYSTAQQYL